MEELIAFIAIFFFVLILVFIIGYILNAILYMTLAKKAGLPNVWLAWIPYGYIFLGVKMVKAPLFYVAIPIFASVLTVPDSPTLTLFGGILLLGWWIYIDGKILEAFGKNRALSALHLLPLFGTLAVFIIQMTVAFGDAKYRLDE